MDRLLPRWLGRYGRFFETFSTTNRRLKLSKTFSLAFLTFLGGMHEALQLEEPPSAAKTNALPQVEQNSSMSTNSISPSRVCR